MRKQNQLSIEIQGHADDRHHRIQRDTWSETRENRAALYLAGNCAVSNPVLFPTVKKKPVAQGSSEAIWSQNRRCEFVIVSSKTTTLREPLSNESLRVLYSHSIRILFRPIMVLRSKSSVQHTP